jgi:hypothetical protein
MLWPMSPARALGDSHNFGRRVAIDGDRVVKPRTVLWEWLLLSSESPLRRVLDAQGEVFAFLPSLAFEDPTSPKGGAVERIELAPLGELDDEARRELARIVGRALALFAWLGVSDLHWENLVLGRAREGRMIFAPLDVEMMLDDLSLPTETRLLPEADADYAELYRHACGVRRALPYLGKPVEGVDLVAMAAAYLRTLELLDRHARTLAEALLALPALHEAPLRVTLRSTGDYVHAHTRARWPPLLDEEKEQLERGDIPYFFRLYGKPGIHCYGDASLDTIKTLPTEGDVPQLAPLLSLARGLRSPSRTTLREQGLFTLLAAFDHRALHGTQTSDGLSVAFRKRTLAITLPDDEVLDAPRDLREVVSSVYLPCACGEVHTPFVPEVTRCDSVRAAKPRGSSRPRG